MEVLDKPTHVVGRNSSKIDAPDKVTGHAQYGADFHPENCLYAVALRSACAHAEIVNRDISKAKALEGVQGVYLSEDIEGTNMHGLIRRDQEGIASKHVRYMGDVVALVVADSLETARQALKLIEIEYKELPGIFSFEDAMAEDAYSLHPKGNILNTTLIRKGDMDAGWKQSDVVVEQTLETQSVDHAFLEPEAGISWFADGILNLYSAGQWLHEERRMVSVALGIPVSKVRVIQPAIGGAFGGREDISIQILLGLAALKHPGHSIKMQYTRAESTISRHKRHPMRVKFKLGATSEGKLTAAEVLIYSDEGAYASTGIAVLRKATSHATGPYKIDNVKVDAYAVFTNNNPTGAMRGFGACQIAYCYETMMNVLAQELKIDPLELRLKNVIQDGDSVTTGQILPNSVGATETLTQAAKEFGWNERSYEGASKYCKKGFGIGNICFGLGYGDGFPDASRAEVRVNEDDSIELLTSAIDYGQGAKTMLGMIVAEQLGVTSEEVSVHTPDTFLTPESGSSSATRQTYFSGNAVKLAADELVTILFDVAVELIPSVPYEMEVHDHHIRSMENHDIKVPLKEVFAAARTRGVEMKGKGLFRPRTTPLDPETGLGDRCFSTYVFGTHMAEVEVDMETGRVRVLRMVAAHDLGKALHPQNAAGQIEGGLAMGVGMALCEEVDFVDGKIRNPGFTDYILPTLRDVPEVTPILVEDEEPLGPFGAKGVGEPPLIAANAAVLNAIHDAIGKPVTKLPAKPETVWKLLNQE